MPVIPRYQADLMQRSDSPVKVTDTDIARAQGQAIAQFGKGLNDLGEVIAAQDKVKEKTKNQIRQKNFMFDASDAADTIYNNAILSSEPDGSNMSTIVKTEYDKYIANRLKQESGSQEYMDLLNLQAKEIRFKTLLKTRDMATKKNLEYADKGFADIKNRYDSQISINPLKYDENNAEYAKLIDDSALVPSVKSIAKEKAKKDFATTAINSYKKAERWDEANDAVNNKFAGIFDDKEREKFIDEIEGTRLRVADRKIKEDNALKSARKEYLEVVNTKFVRTRMAEIQVLRSMDPLQENKVAAVREMEATLDADEASGDITSAQREHLSGLLKKDKTEAMSQNLIPYYVRLAEGKDLDRLAKDVVDNMRDLDPDKVPTLLMLIDKEKERQAKKGGAKKGTDKRLQVAVNKVKAGVGYDVTKGFQKAEDGITLQNALDEFWTEYYKNPKWQNNPSDLADKMLEKYFWDNAKDPTIMNLIHYENLKKASSEAARLNKAGKFQSQKEYLEVLKAIDARAEKEKINSKKDGAKKSGK